MSIVTGNPYRDAPEERTVPVKYPYIKISTPTRRLIQIAENSYIVEKARESEDSLGIKTTHWTAEVVIDPKDDKQTARIMGFPGTGIPSDVVVWILKNL